MGDNGRFNWKILETLVASCTTGGKMEDLWMEIETSGYDDLEFLTVFNSVQILSATPWISSAKRHLQGGIQFSQHQL